MLVGRIQRADRCADTFRTFTLLLILSPLAATNNPAQPISTPAPQVQQASPTDAYTLPPDKLQKAITLGHIRTALNFGSKFWQIAVLILLLSTGVAARTSQWCQSFTPLHWLQSMIFSAFLLAAIFLAQVPITAIGHAFSLHYSISIEPWPAWTLDLTKSLGLTLAIGTPILTLVSSLAFWNKTRRLYWLWFWAAMVPIVVLGAFLLPSLVEPLFNDFEPLAKSHPALVAELEKVVQRTGTNIPPERMFLMRASAKSNGLNAYVTGIGSSKRIVVWDTTANRMPADEILFTFAHESGHYVLNHIPKGLVFGSAGMFALFWFVANLADRMKSRWSHQWHIESLANPSGLVILILAFSIAQVLTEPIENSASRLIEHQADVYGQEAIHGIVPNPQKTAVRAFNHLGEAYLDDPHPNPLLEFWTYDHPSIQNRATFALHYNPWAERQHPRYFPKAEPVY